MYHGGLGRLPRPPRLPSGRLRWPTAPAPTVLDSALTAQKETEGTADFAATLGVGTAGATLLSWVGIKTSLFAGPVAGNNSNSHSQHFSQAFPSPFGAYSLRGFRCYSASGSSNHSVSGTKGASTSEEVTIALLALSGGTIVDDDVSQQDNAGAGHTFTSGSVTVSGSALLVAAASGDGDVNATAPTQTWENGWTVHRSVAFNASQAPNGHVPLYVATKAVGAGTHSVQITTTIDEGLIIALYAVQ